MPSVRIAKSPISRTRARTRSLNISAIWTYNWKPCWTRRSMSSSRENSGTGLWCKIRILSGAFRWEFAGKVFEVAPLHLRRRDALFLRFSSSSFSARADFMPIPAKNVWFVPTVGLSLAPSVEDRWVRYVFPVVYAYWSFWLHAILIYSSRKQRNARSKFLTKYVEVKRCVRKVIFAIE